MAASTTEKDSEMQSKAPGSVSTDTASEEKALPVVPAPQFPEGGLQAWLVVLGCWCTSFASFGYVNSFGVYETYYLQTFLRGYSPSTVSWIGAIQTFAMFSATLLSGPVSDRYGPRGLIWICSLLLVIAMMLTSLCTRFYQFLLCQGILLGISAGLIFAPALAVVGQYFFRKRAMAMAFASTGSPLGGIIYSVIMTSLLNNTSIGFAWAQRICGFLSLFLLGLAAVLIRPTSMRRKGKIFVLEAFKKPKYTLQVLALLMVVFGIWTPYFYLAEYGIQHGMSTGLASYVFALLNGGSFIGRMGAGLVAGYIGQMNAIVFSTFASALLLFCWLAITSTAGIIVLSVLFGATSGIVIALMMSTMAYCADHPSQIGAYVGQATFVIGFAALAGTPITGALINDYHEYTQGIVFSGAVTMAGAVLMSLARYFFDNKKLIA